MRTISALSFFLTVCAACTATAPKLVWETAGFVGPESVVLDAARGQYYVSNMGTYGDGAKENDGFISRVSLDGRILQLKWIEGLSDPKGLAVVGDRLFVGDDPGLAEIDIKAGKLVQWHKPQDGGPGIFNDCTADEAGNVYVCSGRLHAVFRLHDGKLENWWPLEIMRTGGINGLKAEKDRLLLGGWSLLINNEERLGHISTLTYADKKLGRLGTTPICHIDGLEPDGRGGYTVTDWLTGDVFQVAKDGTSTKIFNLGQGTADHLYLADKKLLIIPQMTEHKVRAYSWSPE